MGVNLGLSPLMTRESDIQIASNEYLRYLSSTYFFRHYHIANEGRRSVSYNVKLKRMGMRSGAPDILIEYPEGKILYIELKNEKGKLSQSQKLWKLQSSALKTPHYVVKGNINDCLDQIKRIVHNHIPKRISQK